MTRKTTNKFSPEVRERAVRLVLDHEGDYPSRWAACQSVSAKMGCSAHTLFDWVKKAEVDSGKRAGVPSKMAERMKALEREVRELRQANEILRKAALWDEVKDKLKQSGMGLSGGQQQRMCIARTVAQQPDVILFDEPTSALDPISTGKIEELIEELRQEFTIVIVTHNMQQAARISQYTAFMYLGELIEFGPTTKIFMNPDEKRTLDYVTGRFG